jgi:hypothetical protein
LPIVSAKALRTSAGTERRFGYKAVTDGAHISHANFAAQRRVAPEVRIYQAYCEAKELSYDIENVNKSHLCILRGGLAVNILCIAI